MNPNQQPSQADKILRMLEHEIGSWNRGWVSMPALVAYSGAYAVHSRIAELRKRGHRIENRIERRDDGTRLSWYRLTPDEAAPRRPLQRQRREPAVASSDFDLATVTPSLIKDLSA